MVKILVTGANGQLGKEFRDLESQYANCEFLFLSKEDLPIHHIELVRNAFGSFKPDFCINCAAYTAVDKAEQEKDLAFLVNAESVGVLAAVCKIHNTKFVHVSTDYVYGGTANNPYTEEDKTDPQSVYGSSKLAGEKEAQKHNSDIVILRTSWVYSVHGKNFVKTMVKLMTDKELLSVVADQHGTPTWASDIADVIMKIIQNKTWHPGIYNYSNSGEISWYDFASEIKQLIHSSCEVKPIPTSAYPTPAKRPQYSVLDKTKIISTYDIELRDWKESLKKCVVILEKQ